MPVIPGEGSTLTVVKNQVAIMNALRSLLGDSQRHHGTKMGELEDRIRNTEEYLAECERLGASTGGTRRTSSSSSSARATTGRP